MPFAFIGGIPTAGKSFLAAKLAAEFGLVHIDIDAFRGDMKKDEKLKPWANFFWDKDEEEYLRTVSCEENWKNIKRQSEAFLPTVLQKIQSVRQSGKGAIVEGVNIIPEFAKRNFDFGGAFLLGNSVEEVFRRNRERPRWGKTEALQRKEAELFYYCERVMYKKEAERYGYKTFKDSATAEQELRKLLSDFSKV
ncbi:MAG: hypothetical protein NUV53_02645 [Patescibacteria group bacterium]|nr:hypothetical protein [Patescibacteria group bacterium]